MKCKCGFEIHIPKFCPECGAEISKNSKPESGNKMATNIHENITTEEPPELINDLPPMLTVQEFAKSKNVSKPIIDTWIYRHGLPVVQIGRRVYIEETDYLAWVAEHRKVVDEKPKEKSVELAIPKQCRKSSIADKMRRIY